MSCSLREASAMLRSVRGDRVTFYDLCPEIDYKETRDKGLSAKDLFQGREDLYEQYADEDRRIFNVRIYCSLAIRRMGKNLSPSRVSVLKPLAAYLMGVSNCGELSIAACIEAIGRGKRAAQLVVSGQENAAMANHAFAIYGQSLEHLNNIELELSNKKTIELAELQALAPGAMVVDPFLNEAFQIEDFSGSALDQYCRNCNFTKIFHIVIAPVLDHDEAEQGKLALIHETESIKEVVFSFFQ